MRRFVLLTAIIAMMYAATSPAQTIVIDHGADFAGGAAGNQATIDLFTSNFPGVTVVAGNYDNTADAGVQAAIEAADVLVLCRTTYSGGYDTADGAYYSSLEIPVVFLTSYVTRSSRIGFEGGLNGGGSTDGAETTVTAAGALVFGVEGFSAGTHDWYTDGYGFDTLGTGSVGTGDILATLGGNHLAVGWDTGDTDGSGRTQSGPRLLFNLHSGGNTLPDTVAGKQALLAAVTTYTGLSASSYAAISPDPAKGAVADLATLAELSWQASPDPNIASVDYDVFFGTEPNIVLNPLYTDVATPFNLADNGIYLDYNTRYYWRVDSHITWDSNELTGHWQDIAVGDPWFFDTLPDDKVPAVTADGDILTSLGYLPAGLTGTVNDWGEGDIQSVSWEVLGAVVPQEAKQMITRNDAAALSNLAQITTDPNLLMDWIGTDTRNDQAVDTSVGDPMLLVLKGLPAGTYSWTSYHHDAGATFTGMFDATVTDATGSITVPDIQITDSNSLPVGTFTASITSNGTDAVILVFDLHPYAGLGYNDAWFVMNGFELTDASGSLYVDFGNSAADNVMRGYAAYFASHEAASTFTEQSYSVFGTTVSILPTWGGLATVTDTTNNASSAIQSATFNTNWPGSYLVRLSATDHQQTGSDTLTVRVAADACAAAQLDPAWSGFNDYDADQDCDVDLSDFAVFGLQWLDDRNASGPIQL